MMSLFSSFDLSYFKFNCLMFLVLIFIPFYILNFGKSMKMIKIFNSSLKTNLLSSSSNHTKFSTLMFCFIFFFIFLMNSSSLLPYIFSYTSRLSLILSLSVSLYLSILFFMLKNNIKFFLSHLVPEGSPIYLIVILFLIEIISSLIRPLTLTIRLVSNLLAGHVLMGLIYLATMEFSSFFLVYCLMNIIEILVSFIQAYIFFTLLNLYYSEIFNLEWQN